jgi:hypothetical protein
MTSHDYCAICQKHDLVVPIHDDKGSPSGCLICAGKWHAEHGRRGQRKNSGKFRYFSRAA